MSPAGDEAPLKAEEILRDCNFFSQVKPEGFAKLAAIAVLRSFQKGERIFRQQQECPGMFIVGRGLVRVFKTAPTGKEHVLHMVGPGNTFAEVAAIGGFRCPANAEAVTPTVCALLPADLFQKLLAENHPLCLEILVGLTFWVKHLVTLVEDISLRDALGRLARFLVEMQPLEDGAIELPSLKRHVASHLNLTSETFSRTLSRLIEAELVVELDGNRLELRDREALRRLADGQPLGGEKP
jgi:CRP/FNR family transcriptional regulator